MRRSCRYEKQLAVYSSLDPFTRHLVDAHLRECPACAARLASYDSIDQTLRTLPDLRLPAGLLRPWPGLTAVPDRRLHHGFGFVVGRVLLPASLIIGLVAGFWLFLTALSGEDSRVNATPTLTLTPTATAVAFLVEIDEAAVKVDLSAFPAPRAALYPTPQPTFIAAQTEANSGHYAPLRSTPIH
jgi:anti-sigma factor RsiW